MQQAGFKVAVDEINARGGVNGQKLELLLEDDASDTNKALTAAEKLVNEKVPVVIGAYSSGMTKPLSQYMARVKVPLLVATAIDETITKPGNAYTFRVNNQSSVYTRSLITELKRIGGMKTAVVLTSNDAFGKSVLTDATRLLPAAGFTVLSKDTYDKGLTDFRPLLNRYKGQNPDVVIFASYEEDAVALAKQVKETGLSPQTDRWHRHRFCPPRLPEGCGEHRRELPGHDGLERRCEVPGRGQSVHPPEKRRWAARNLPSTPRRVMRRCWPPPTPSNAAATIPKR